MTFERRVQTREKFRYPRQWRANKTAETPAILSGKAPANDPGRVPRCRAQFRRWSHGGRRGPELTNKPPPSSPPSPMRETQSRVGAGAARRAKEQTPSGTRVRLGLR